MRAVDSTRWCHEQLKLSTGVVLNTCQLPKGHPGKHRDGSTTWAWFSKPTIIEGVTT